MKKYLLMMLLTILATIAKAQNTNIEPKRWSIQAGGSSISLASKDIDSGDFFLCDDEGWGCYIAGDYYLTKRFALTGQIYWEQVGLATDYSSKTKKINMLGAQAGAKFYFFPRKWLIQPHIGASLQTNVLNLSSTRGSEIYIANKAQPGTSYRLDYDVQSPGISIVPKIGVDLHLFTSVALSFDADFRYGLWGHRKYEVKTLDGPYAGQICRQDYTNFRTAVSIGLKIDFPAKDVSENAMYNLWSVVGKIIDVVVLRNY